MKSLSAPCICITCFFWTYGASALASAPEPTGQAEHSDQLVANIALGAKYTLHPAPNYRHCTDPDDVIQLTDGKTTTGYFWTQTSTVGWSSAAYVVITVDLGKVQPIAGVSFNTAAGAAQVTWPAAIQILTSDDGKTYHNAGDLVELDRKAHGPLPEGYAIRRLATDGLQTRGRYVRFVAVPPAGGSYLFVDEVEVFRGPDELLAKPPAGEQVDDVAEVFIQWRSNSALAHRFQADAAAMETRLREATLSDEVVRAGLLDRLAAVREALDPAAVRVDRSFQAILPLSEAHGRLFRLQADLWRAMGHAPLVAEAAGPWDPLDPFALPSIAGSDRAVEVHTMRGEHRAAAVNLYNSTEEPIQVQLHFEGLPGQPAPGYVTVYEVDWTDTGRGVPVAAALMEAVRADNAWSIRVPPGLVRQVWMKFCIPRGEEAVAAGVHEGRILLSSPATAGPAAVPVRLHVYPAEFPEKTTLLLGGWSYTNGRGAYGMTPENRVAFLSHLQERYVNAPWATGAVLMNYTFGKDAPDRIELNTEQLDAWLAEWPSAQAYMVFLGVGDYSGASKAAFAGAALGTPEFDRRVGTWISAWVRHLRGKGIEPNRLGLLIHDEPHEGSDVTALVAWSRAIRAAEPEVRLWLDPCYREPAKAPAEVFEVTGVLSPMRRMWLEGGEPFAEFYREQRRRGKQLHFYSCSGPARLLDPYAYYRLQAWQCWREGAGGTFFWAFGDNSGASSWNEYLARSGPYTPLFLDATRVVPGKQMEAVRESVQDYETLLLLERAIARAEQSGRDDPAVKAARRVLQSAAAEVLDADGATQLDWHDAKDRSIADAVRARVLQALAALNAEP
ncbi:MAG: discoidin domain-containing protein [Thermoguttaceae bacterium]|jgi:hypothetical protein|nr:discoidin domain-containing protein [Thermoguttaceae bacterium]